MKKKHNLFIIRRDLQVPQVNKFDTAFWDRRRLKPQRDLYLRDYNARVRASM